MHLDMVCSYYTTKYSVTMRIGLCLGVGPHRPTIEGSITPSSGASDKTPKEGKQMKTTTTESERCNQTAERILDNNQITQSWIFDGHT